MSGSWDTPRRANGEKLSAKKAGPKSLDEIEVGLADMLHIRVSERKIFLRRRRAVAMFSFIRSLWSAEQGQDIAEYAVMLAVILVLVVGTIRLVGSNANTVFSNVASSVH
jgi:Flp pilus assembly pilin Flp